MIQVGSDRVPMGGMVHPRFEQVRNEFRRNFAERGEIGAACAIVHNGEKVVDLWGGYREAHACEPWEENTLVTVFSTTKGIAAMVMAVAHSQGLFDLDEPVATYWPEFAQQAKRAVTVRQLLAHQAGLTAVDASLDAEKLADLDWLADVIARQRTAWEPGTRHGYHGLSLGFYQNELIRRVDAQGRSLGRFLQDQIMRVLGVEFYVGLPADVEPSRIAKLEPIHPLRVLLNMLPRRMALALMWPGSLTTRSLWNPRLQSAGDMASPAYRAVEIPSANGIGNARALAAAYGVLAMGGQQLGITPRTMHELTRRPDAPTMGCRDMILRLETLYSFGFWKPCPTFPYGSSEKTFGAMGAGGSVGFADPDIKLGFGYVTNKMGFHLVNDPRERALRHACYECLK